METIILLFMCVLEAMVAVAVRPALMLTPYLNEDRLSEARNLSLVDPNIFLNIKSYSGFFTVDEKYNSNMFFWYFPIANRVVEDTPWIIWLQGGPGASSLIGLFDEMGPLQYNNSYGFQLRETSWWNDFSMVFIDNPVGAGFSFTDHVDGLSRDMETYTSNLLSTLRQLLTLFPELRRAPLYLAGSSYAGRYVTALAATIADDFSNDCNLQGLILGNPVFDRESIMDYPAVFYQWGIIDEQGLLAVKPLQTQFKEAIDNGQSQLAANLRNDLLDKLQSMSFQNEMYNILKDSHEELRGFVPVVNNESVRQALHVGELEFSFINTSVHRSLELDFLSRVSPKIERFLDQDRKILIYCGQLDLMAPCVQNAHARRREWRWSRREQFLAAPRQPWWLHGTVAGYVKSGGGLTEALVRGAGHIAPWDKPAEIQELVLRFIKDEELDIAPGFFAGEVPEYADVEWYAPEQTVNGGLVASLVINAAFVVVSIALVVFYIKRKKNNDVLFIPLRDDIFNVA